MSDCPHCRRPARYGLLLSLRTDSIYVCPFCERLSRYRIRPATAAKAFFWTILWASLFLGGLISGDIGLGVLFFFLSILAILSTPYIYGGLTPRFHHQGQAFEPGSRRYRTELWIYPLVYGIFLIGVGLFGSRTPFAAGEGTLIRLSAGIIQWLGWIMGGLSLLNAGFSFRMAMVRSSRRQRRRGLSTT